MAVSAQQLVDEEPVVATPHLRLVADDEDEVRQIASDILALLERALLNPLRRAGYPFDAAPYDKRQALARLHATIDEHLRPFEPSIPRWLHGGARE